VRAYHGVLQGLGLKPQRPLEDDMKLMTQVMSYGARAQAVVPAGGRAEPGGNGAAQKPEPPKAAPSATPPRMVAQPAQTPARPVPAGQAPASRLAAAPTDSNGRPDLAKMTPEERLAYHRDRIRRI
jgi:hypothetical protein